MLLCSKLCDFVCRSSWRSVRSSWHSGRRGSPPSRNSRHGLLISTRLLPFLSFFLVYWTFLVISFQLLRFNIFTFSVVTVVERWANYTFLVPSIWIFYACLDSYPQSRRNGLRIQPDLDVKNFVFGLWFFLTSHSSSGILSCTRIVLNWVLFVISSFSHLRYRCYLVSFTLLGAIITTIPCCADGVWFCRLSTRPSGGPSQRHRL